MRLASRGVEMPSLGVMLLFSVSHTLLSLYLPAAAVVVSVSARSSVDIS